MAPVDFGNPDPKRFTIAKYHQAKRCTVVEVVYPDAKNYEGRKVMLYKASLSVVAAQQTLDPHFCDDASHLSPFARFEPTPEGWSIAVALANIIS